MRLPARLTIPSLHCIRSITASAYRSGPISRPRMSNINFQQVPSSRQFASVMGSVRRITDELEKPDLDDRSYRVIELPNKLEALLVHDAQTDKASASLNVNVGNFSDEEDMPGMAHAVEHLLFMGTEKVSLGPEAGHTSRRLQGIVSGRKRVQFLPLLELGTFKCIHSCHTDKLFL